MSDTVRPQQIVCSFRSDDDTAQAVKQLMEIVISAFAKAEKVKS